MLVEYDFVSNKTTLTVPKPMNPVPKMMPYWLHFKPSQSDLIPYEPDCTDLKSNSSNFLLGIVSALVALPIITLIVMLSVFFSQRKWEEFWDDLLDI